MLRGGVLSSLDFSFFLSFELDHDLHKKYCAKDREEESMPPRKPFKIPPVLRVILKKERASSVPANVQVLQTKLRSSQLRARKAESVVAEGVWDALHDDDVVPLVSSSSTSTKVRNLNALTQSAQALVTARQQAQTAGTVAIQVQELERDLKAVEQNMLSVKRSLNNLRGRYTAAKARENARLRRAMAQKDTATAALIRQNWLNIESSSRDETLRLRRNLQELMSQYHTLSSNYNAATKLQQQAQEAEVATQQATQQLVRSVRQQQQQQSKRKSVQRPTTTTTTTPVRRRKTQKPPSRRR